MCRVLGVSASGYYAWRGRGRSRRAKRDEELRGTIRTIHKESGGTYGVPRVHAELHRRGCPVSRKRVARLMRETGLAGVSRRCGTRTTRRELGHRAPPDRVERVFQAGEAAKQSSKLHLGRRYRAPRGALEPCGGERPPPPARRSGPVEAEGSLTRGTPAKVEAALTTTGRASTVRWRGPGKRDGKVYARNQRQKAPQAKTTSSNLADRGWVATRTWLASAGRGTLRPVDIAGREATVKNCGVTVARLQGHSWAPTPLKGSRVNVGTTSSVPAVMVGKTCRRSTPTKWGGGPVVVRARESRVHGEGVQCARSIDARRGGRW